MHDARIHCSRLTAYSSLSGLSSYFRSRSQPSTLNYLGGFLLPTFPSCFASGPTPQASRLKQYPNSRLCQIVRQSFGMEAIESEQKAGNFRQRMQSNTGRMVMDFI